MAQVTAPSISVTPTIATGDLSQRADGSFVQYVVVSFNGANRPRQIGISADGLSFTLDGVSIASPPPALLALGTATVNYQTKRDTTMAGPGLQALLTAP